MRTIATPPPCFSIISVTTAALPFGLIFAQTRSSRMPTCFAIASAVPFASPVNMFTSTPIASNAFTACLDDFLGASESAIAVTIVGREEPAETDTKMAVRP